MTDHTGPSAKQTAQREAVNDYLRMSQDALPPELSIDAISYMFCCIMFSYSLGKDEALDLLAGTAANYTLQDHAEILARDVEENS